MPIIRITNGGAGRGEIPVQIPLGLLMVAIGITAIALAVLVLAPIPAAVALITLLVGFGVYRIAKLPRRIRLTVEVVTALFLLALSIWVWQAPFYLTQADRAQQLARLCATLADSTDSPRARDLFRREGAWYERKALGLQVQALCYGWIRAVSNHDHGALSDQELVLELGLLESLERHQRIAEPMGIEGQPR